MRECEKYMEMLSALMDNALDEGKAELAQHLKTCKSCYLKAQQYLAVNQVISDEASMVEVPDTLLSNVMQAVEKEASVSDDTAHIDGTSVSSAVHRNRKEKTADKEKGKTELFAAYVGKQIRKLKSAGSYKALAAVAAVLVVLIITAIAVPAAIKSGKSKDDSTMMAADSAFTTDTSAKDSAADTGSKGSSAKTTLFTDSESPAESTEAPEAQEDVPDEEVGNIVPDIENELTEANKGESEPRQDSTDMTGLAVSPDNAAEEETVSDGLTVSKTEPEIASAVNVNINGFVCGAIIRLNDSVTAPDVLEQYTYQSWLEGDYRYIIISSSLYEQLTDSLSKMNMPFGVDLFGGMTGDNWVLLIAKNK